MKKKTTVVIVALLALIGTGLFIYINQSPSSNINEVEEEREEDIKKENELTEEKKIDNEAPDTNRDAEQKVNQIITDAVQSAIDFFINRKTEIVALGDSLTQGVGDATGQGGYVGILDRTINAQKELVHFENYGRQGDRTQHLLSILDDPTVSRSVKDAQIILITIGANDIMKVVKENFTNLTYEAFAAEQVNYEKRLREIFDKIRELNKRAEIYLIGFYNPFQQYFQEVKELNIIVNNWNDASESITEEYEGITYIPTKDLFDDHDVNLFAEDHFHPNHSGYERMARRVLKYLTEER